MIGNNNRIGEDLHDLKKYGIICHVPVMMYMQQLNLILFERNIHYNVKLLKKKKIVQSMHVTTTKFSLVYLDKKKENKDSTSNDSNRK